MRKDIWIAIIGAVILIGWLLSRAFYNHKEDEIIYVTCDSFASQQEAQQYFTDNQATHLDNDKDGIACEEKALATPANFTPRIIRPSSVVPTPIKSTQPIPQPTQTTPVIKVEGKATVVVEEKKTEKEEAKEEKKKDKSTSTPSATPTTTPIPTTLACVLGICI